MGSSAVRKSEAVVGVPGKVKLGKRQRLMSMRDIRMRLGDGQRPLSYEGFAKLIGSKRSTVFFWEHAKKYKRGPMPPEFQAKVQAALARISAANHGDKKREAVAK